MSDTPIKTEAARKFKIQARLCNHEGWERATLAMKKWGEVMTALFRKLREETVTQKRFYEATKGFYK